MLFCIKNKWGVLLPGAWTNLKGNIGFSSDKFNCSKVTTSILRQENNKFYP